MAEIRINPETSDYEMDARGFPVATNELTQAAYIRLRAHLGEWLYDPLLGSTIFRPIDKAVGQGQEEIVRRAERALQPLIDDGRASSVAVKLLERTRYNQALDISIVDARTNQAVSFPFFVPVP